MKRVVFSVIILALSIAATRSGYARDTKLLLPIATAMEGANNAKEKLSGSVRFFFGNQPHPKVLTTLGTNVSNPWTNAFGKSDETACNWVFLSAIIALDKRAKQLGANAVVNIVSYYQNVEMSSPTEFECHAGATIARVTLKGDFVKLADQ